jgi:hypothetical protein
MVNRPDVSRRLFLWRAAMLAAAFPFIFRRGGARPLTEEKLLPADEAILLRRLGTKRDLSRLPAGELVAEMGRSFLGRPYRANTLEEEGEEHLVVDLREFDCVTLCETSLALARAIKLRIRSTEGYCAQLQLIRYRSGIIRGYPSRLHYFSEWIADNEQKKVLQNVTVELGGRRDTRKLDFMSAHRKAYPRLDSPDAFDGIAAVEKNLEAIPRYFVPKENVAGIEGKIQSGDIIAVTTSVTGLDVSHAAIAVREGGTMRLLHAPNVGERVQYTSRSIAEYLHRHEQQTGIIVARPLDSES